jgi:hypothetical protein
MRRLAAQKLAQEKPGQDGQRLQGVGMDHLSILQPAGPLAPLMENLTGQPAACRVPRAVAEWQRLAGNARPPGR